MKISECIDSLCFVCLFSDFKFYFKLVYFEFSILIEIGNNKLFYKYL